MSLPCTFRKVFLYCPFYSAYLSILTTCKNSTVVLHVKEILTRSSSGLPVIKLVIKFLCNGFKGLIH